MTIDEFARLIDASLCHLPSHRERDIRRFSAADTMSSLIAQARPDSVLVPSLNNLQVARVAELMDVPAICLVGGAAPCDALITCADAAGIAVLVTGGDLALTKRKLSAVMGDCPRGASFSR